MAETGHKDDLFELWMIYSTKTDIEALEKYIALFVDCYKDLIDVDLNHLHEGFSEQGPYITKLPDGILQVFGNQLHQCCFSDDNNSVSMATSLLKCLIIMCRNHDSVPLIASCEFTSYTVNIASKVIDKLQVNLESDSRSLYVLYLRLTLHFFECLYDPYFVWRKRHLGWRVDNQRMKNKPALLHVEIIPFFHECIRKKWLPAEIKFRFIHLFGALISGSQYNALKAITPATLDVLLKILAINDLDGPTNEQRQEMGLLKDLVLKCLVQMIHVIHACSPDQRQVEVCQVMEGYMQVLLDADAQSENEIDKQTQLAMIGAINEMLSCQDKSALQVILVSGSTFDSFISLLQKTSLCGKEAQCLAMSILKVMNTVLAGSGNAKDRFKLRVGYSRFVDVLKSLGQPSMELLKSVLNLVVECTFDENTKHTVHNTHAAVMLIQWLPDIQSHDLQIWLSANLRGLCSLSHTNKMNCCKDGMISAVLAVLGREKQINPTAVGHLIGLLECLGTQSITAIELKQLIGLLRLDDEGNQNSYCSRLMRALSTMARREGKEGALHFFNIQEQTDGIILPGIRKWPGPAFSFHTWLCLNSPIGGIGKPTLESYRRILYSFVSSSGNGFECFINTEGEIITAVHTKKEYNTVTVPDTDLLDGHWHSICISHTNSKRPFGTSQIVIFVDGKHKHSAQLKFPNMTEPFNSCRVGSQVLQSSQDLLETTLPSNHTTKKQSPIKSLIQSATKSGGNIPGVITIPLGSRDDTWGKAMALDGQIGSICVFHEAVTAGQVKAMYLAGPNNLTVFNDESELTDLPGKMVLHYNARACKESHVMDLSPNQNHGQLIGQKCVTWDIKDVLNCIGGIQVLFPLLEQINQLPMPVEPRSPDIPFINSLNQAIEQDDWVVLPSSSYADTKLEQNQVAGFLTLLRNMVQTKPVNQHSFVQTNSAAVIGALLQKVNPKLIDVHVLMAIQLLIEATALTNKTLLNHLYQYVLFDFRIWCRSDFPVRIGHIQYLSTIIKDDRRYFRKQFGVQYILDNIRMYYGKDSGLSEEDAKTIRGSLLSLVKYYIIKDITLEELSQLFNFMLTCNVESMICEALDVLISLLHADTGRRQDQLYLLLFEPEMGEMLYGLLVVRGYTIIYYEKVVKVLYLLLKTDKVYEKSKNRLRLLECGYLGLIGLIEGFEVSGPTIKRFLEMVSTTDTLHTYNSVLAVLQLICTSGFDIKLEASRQLLSILVTKNGAANFFGKQLGWQEAITTLFVLNSLETTDFRVNEVDAITMATNNGCETNKSGDTNKDCDSEGNTNNLIKFDLSEGSDSAISLTASIQQSTDSHTETGNVSHTVADSDSHNAIGSESLSEKGNISLSENGKNSQNKMEKDSQNKIGRDSQDKMGSHSQDKMGSDSQDKMGKDSQNKMGKDSHSVLEGDSHAVVGSDSPLLSPGLQNKSSQHSPITHPNSLDLSASKFTRPSGDYLNPYTPSGPSPATPMYMKHGLFPELNNSASEDDLRPMSRSSSNSADDLSMIAQRAADRKSQRNDEMESSSSQPLLHDHFGQNGVLNDSKTMTPSPSLVSSMSISQSESGLDLTEDVELRRESMSSMSHVNSKDRMLDSLGLRGSFLMDDVADSDELCQNLLIVLFTVMWKGVEGSDNNTWKERGQVFSWLDHLSDTNQLILDKDEIKRRLLEMMLHDCSTSLRDAGHSNQMENAVELVRLVRFFLVEYETEHGDQVYSEMLLEDVMTLLDSLAVWDVQSGAGWQEMVHLGLSILLVFAKQPNLELCASATARLHMLVQTKLISSSAEAAYLIGHLNTLILKAVDDETDNYSYLIPVMKALIDKAYKLMLLDINLPTLPSTSMSPTFFDDFKTYCKSEEWIRFIDNYVKPQMEHFTENVFQELAAKTAEFWESCHEEMMLNLHKRNRERGESKLKFQSQVMDGYEKKCTSEDKRFQNISTQLKNQHLSALRQWRATKRFFTGERGAWAERHSTSMYWKLSNQENFSRMKVKLIQNYNFDIHGDASFLRDNQGIEDIERLNEIKLLSVAKEAVVAKDNIADDIIGDEEWTVISSSSQSNEEQQGKEKLVLSEECELVTLVEVIKGRLEVTTTHVYFFDCSSSKEEGGEDFKWSLSLLREIHFRRYNLRRSALELFLIDQTNYFLNFQKKVRNKVYSRILSLRPPNLIYYGSRSPAELLKSSGLTQKWIQREISNFEYLMQLNTIAGRTYNDLSQYPVFPWILTDYTSESLDLENPAVFRDLSKPVGALNPDNIADIQEKFDNFEDPGGVIEKFHYGTHYSNAATVMHYMIRMEPFTTLHIQLQSDRFDVSDRQFHSLPATWKSMYKNTNDVKELIPEFFYLPEFLVNSNRFDLGKLQISHERVDHVILPPWANSPEDFIHQHRKALESEHVSNNLHNWIDLIFGYKQKGQAAIDAINVFYYCTYEGAVDLDAVKNPTDQKALEGMINNFGQTPCQLLKDAHPKRMAVEDVVVKAMKTDKHLNVFHFLDHLKVFFVEVSPETDPLVYMIVPRSQIRSIIQHGMPDTMITISSEGILGTHGWLPYDKSITNFFTFEKDPSVSNLKTRKKFSCPFAPGLKVESKLFVVSHDSKLLFSGGHWDNSLQVFNVGRARKINHICRHNDIVTCLALDYCGSHLITGSRDTTCMIWHVIQQSGVSQNISSKPLVTLYGHDDEVTAVHLSTELDMAVSASKDGTVMIHTVRKGHYMRTLRPPCTPSYTLTIPMIAVDDMGHIVVNCYEHFPIDPKEKTSLHLYSLNGKHLHSKEVENVLGHMIIKGEYLITGDVAGDVTIYEIFGLHQLAVVPLHVPVHSLTLTNGNSHLLAGLRDGKLIIIGIKSKADMK